MGNHSIMNGPLETTKIMAGYPDIGFSGFVSELDDEHLEFGGVLICSTWTLVDSLGTFGDIGLGVGRQMLFLERFEEYFEGGERFNTLIRIDVPYLRGVAKPSCREMGLFVIRDLCEFHIFLHTKHPSGDGAD